MLNKKRKCNVANSRGFQKLRGRSSNYAHCTKKCRLVNLILNLRIRLLPTAYYFPKKLVSHASTHRWAICPRTIAIGEVDLVSTLSYPVGTGARSSVGSGPGSATFSSLVPADTVPTWRWPYNAFRGWMHQKRPLFDDLHNRCFPARLQGPFSIRH